jgi:hypothetical protein
MCLINTRYCRKLLKVILTTLLPLIFTTGVFAFPTYEGCKDCHGDFREDNYVSNQDQAPWGQSLMSGHESFVGDECGACHKSGSRGEVFLNFSADSSLSKSCVGCHGRQQDVTGSCTGLADGLGGMEVECGSGAGLRQHHETQVASGTCLPCHSGDPAPVGEHVLPYNYGRSGVVIQDSCDADGTESRFGNTGLDNDGDDQYDAGDADCSTNTPPTQPGTLSSSAVTTNSATIHWGASSDVDGDTITYLVEYRQNGTTTWNNGGNTTSTSQALSSLDDNQSYDVRVTPNDGEEDGADRTALNLFLTETINTPPTQPGPLSASDVTTNSANISWDPSDDINGDTVTYQVEYRRNGDVPWSVAGNTSNTIYPLSGLNDDQAYDVRVTPNDTHEDGISRIALNLFTTEIINTPPTQPGALSFSALTFRSVIIHWGASDDIDGDTVTYHLEYRRNGDIDWNNGGFTTQTSMPLDNLESDQSYDVQVTPNDSIEDGDSIVGLNLFTTDVDTGSIFKDGFEDN